MKTTDLAQALFAEAFSVVRQKRSGPYQLGCINYLRWKLDGVNCGCPFSAGTAQCDAYLAGVEEGREILRQHSLKLADGEEVTPEVALRAAQAMDRQRTRLDAERKQMRAVSAESSERFRTALAHLMVASERQSRLEQQRVHEAQEVGCAGEAPQVTAAHQGSPS